MRAQDLKLGDIYIPIGGPLPFRNVRHLVIKLAGTFLKYRTLDDTFKDGSLLYPIGLIADVYYNDLNSWRFYLNSKRKSPLPEWW